MTLQEIVDRIPVDQKARATRETKAFLLGKLSHIRQNRQVLEEAARKKKQEEVLEGYKKAVKYKTVFERITKAEIALKRAEEELLNKEKAELKEANEALLKLGLSREGYLFEVHDKKSFLKGPYEEHGRHGRIYKVAQARPPLPDNIEEIPDYWIYDHQGTFMPITKAVAEQIAEVKKLLKAVGREMEVFSTYDQLETRMMMASTVGECMAIVNAVANQEIFKIQTDVLQLEDEKKK